MTAQPDRWFTSRQVAEILAISPKTVARWARDGHLPRSRTLGGHRRHREADILALRDRLTQGGRP